MIFIENQCTIHGECWHGGARKKRHDWQVTPEIPFVIYFDSVAARGDARTT